MALERGKLVLSKKGKPQIEIDGNLFNPAQGELSQSILENLTKLNGVDVEFEREHGLPKKIRKAGTSFEPPQVRSHHGNNPKQMEHRREPQRRVHAVGDCTETRTDFHNPYNFIPALARNTNDPDLGDHKPALQDRFDSDKITGRIQIKLEVITPLLIPDPNSCKISANGHKTFGLLLGKDGKPMIPSSSIRGMLRTAYEAVTNSRFGVFQEKEHRNRLAYRMKANNALQLIPARIENGQIHLLPGTISVGRAGVRHEPQYAAWLPRYSGPMKNTHHAKKYPDGSLPKHGDEVECLVELIQHHRWIKRENRHESDFRYWRVLDIVKAGNPLSNITPIYSVRSEGHSWHESLGSTQKIRGWVCITNANIKNKHDERVFFCQPSSALPRPIQLTDAHRNKWRELIENYQKIHADELKKRLENNQTADQYNGPDPGKTAFSRHIYTKTDSELKDRTLCYVRLTENQHEVQALFPVMIARDLYNCSPWDLLDSSLRPALKISELSPADRVFGWVLTNSQETSGASRNQKAVRGQLRVSPICCESSVEESIEVFSGAGLPLAILAAPKPQQGRFYVSRSKRGEAQSNGLSNIDAGYTLNKGLRGRKVYPHHHSLPDRHWENPMNDNTQRQTGPWQEYRRPKLDGVEKQNDQNRSMLGWVKPGSRFNFNIYITNLSKAELGALLFILNLPLNYFHRFGGGKPLGFGSIRLMIDAGELFTGDNLRDRYCSWTAQKKIDDTQTNFDAIKTEAIAAFRNAVLRVYTGDHQDSFEEVPFIEAFLMACKGFNDNLPIHYPRATENGQPGPPDPKGEFYRWFVANESCATPYALSDLATDNGLPTLRIINSNH